MVAPLAAAAPSLISAGASLLGGLFGNKSSKDTARENAAFQKEFAQQGIQWKVADAKKAGIHPLYALGAQTHSFNPVVMQDSLGPALSSAGQDISRAMQAAATQPQRAAADATSAVLGKLAIERATLENEELRSRIARERSAQLGPPFPSGVQTFPIRSGDVHTTHLTADSVGPGTVRVTPVEVDSSSPSVRGQTAGSRDSMTEYKFGDSDWLLPSDKFAQATEDMDLIKYAATVSANWPQISTRFREFIGGIPRPAWVRRQEARRGVKMVPVSKQGKLYWRFVDNLD